MFDSLKETSSSAERRVMASRRHRQEYWLSLILAALIGCQAAPPLAAPPEPRAPAPRAQLAAPVPIAAVPQPGRTVPISLDTVLRLAQQQNNQIQLARARMQEAFADQALACKRWLPDLYVGPSYNRHEGGIQDFQGNLIQSSYGSVLAGMQLNGKLDPREAILQGVEAERKIWQQKGELSKLTSDNLLDAATTYVDLLAARSGESVSHAAEVKLGVLLEQTRKLAEIDPGVRVEVSRIEAELSAEKVLTRKLAVGARTTAAKLTYLLGLDPACDLLAVERQLVPIALVDAQQPVQALVAQAFAQGPGVRELEGLLQVIEEARTQAEGPQRWLPTVQLFMNEGAFGAGPGSNLDWANRWDMLLNVRWNLTEVLTARERRQQADAKMRQLHLNYQDLRAKLTLGVQEARETALSGVEQVGIAEERITQAELALGQSESRWQESIKGRSPSEVLLAIRSLAGARLEYVQTVRDLDKAQLRLLVLTGALGTKSCP
jgi:outer membrane protein TolC